MGWMVEQNMEKPILGTDHSWVAPKNTHNIPISQSLIIVVWHSHMIFPCQPIVSHLMIFFCVNHAWLRSLMIDRLIHIVYPYPVCWHSIFLFGVASHQICCSYLLAFYPAFSGETLSHHGLFMAPIWQVFPSHVKVWPSPAWFAATKMEAAIFRRSRNGELSNGDPNIRYIYLL